jgi:hypothetical protein
MKPLSAFKRSNLLLSQSYAILRGNESLVWLPVVSAFFSLLVLITFIGPILAFHNVTFPLLVAKTLTPKQSTIFWLYTFVDYIISFGVVTFFNTALMYCAKQLLSGNSATSRDGIAFAWTRIRVIAGWAVVSATVGVVLRMIEDRVPFVARIAMAAVGTVWSIATFFVVPSFVYEDISIVDALKKSGSAISKTWGVGVAYYFSFGIIELVFVLVSLIPVIFGIISQNVTDIVVGVGITLVALIVYATYSTALKAIYETALYQYSLTGVLPSQYDPELITGAFRNKKKA